MGGPGRGPGGSVVDRQLPVDVRVAGPAVPPDPCSTHLPSTPRMSDSDGDFSDELLELAGATEKKRKRREGSSKSETKRRKAEYVVPPCLLYRVLIAFPV
jgi:hypothetical protein